MYVSLYARVYRGIHVTVDPPTFCLVAISKVESKELELNYARMCVLGIQSMPP